VITLVDWAAGLLLIFLGMLALAFWVRRRISGCPRTRYFILRILLVLATLGILGVSCLTASPPWNFILVFILTLVCVCGACLSLGTFSYRPLVIIAISVLVFVFLLMVLGHVMSHPIDDEPTGSTVSGALGLLLTRYWTLYSLVLLLSVLGGAALGTLLGKVLNQRLSSTGWLP